MDTLKYCDFCHKTELETEGIFPIPGEPDGLSICINCIKAPLQDALEALKENKIFYAKIAELRDCIKWDESKELDNGYKGPDYHSRNEMVSSPEWVLDTFIRKLRGKTL